MEICKQNIHFNRHTKNLIYIFSVASVKIYIEANYYAPKDTLQYKIINICKHIIIETIHSHLNCFPTIFISYINE